MYASIIPYKSFRDKRLKPARVEHTTHHLILQEHTGGLKDTWYGAPRLKYIRRWNGVSHGNQGNNLCHKLGSCCGGRVHLVGGHGGDGGDSGGEGVPSDVREGPQSPPKLGEFR